MILTPLEKATGITINTPDDVIADFKICSLLIYCYKNDKDLVEWLTLIPDDIVMNRIGEKKDKEYDDDLMADLTLTSMFLNLMKLGDWGQQVHEDILAETIDKLLKIPFAMEFINRKVKAGSSKVGIDIDKMIVMKLSGKQKNKWDLDNYTLQGNPKYSFNNKKKG